MGDKTDKLLVSWKGPHSGSNYFVGLLTKYETDSGSRYTFRYIKEVVKEAQKEGFTPFVGLKNLNKEYVSDKLFSIFERRLPSHNRHIFKKVVQEYHLENSSDVSWEYLKITKGKTATDQLSILEPLYYMENNQLLYQGEVAGWSFTKDKNTNLKIKNKLILSSDKNNPEDECAVEILDPANDNERVGYIQKPYNKVFFHLLNQGYSIHAFVRSISPEDKRPSITIQEKVRPWDIKGKMFDYLISFN